MPQAIDDRTRPLRNVGDLAVGRIAKQYGEDLVVGLASLEHAKSADWPRLKKDLATRHGSVCQRADTERITVAVRDGWAARECVRRNPMATLRARANPYSVGRHGRFWESAFLGRCRATGTNGTLAADHPYAGITDLRRA